MNKLLDFAVGLYAMSSYCNCHGSGLVLVSNAEYALVFVRRLVPVRSAAISLAWPVSVGGAFVGLIFVCRLFALTPPASAVAWLLPTGALF